jgi:hypothetical protein
MLLELLISCAPGSSLRVAVKIQTSELLQRGAKPSRRPFRSKVCEGEELCGSSVHVAVKRVVRFKCARCSQKSCAVHVCTLQSKELCGLSVHVASVHVAVKIPFRFSPRVHPAACVARPAASARDDADGMFWRGSNPLGGKCIPLHPC